MKRKITEYAHQCDAGHWSWSEERPLDACPHMVKGKRCQEYLLIKGHKQVTVEQ